MEVLWSDQGSYSYSPKLSKQLFYSNQPTMRFRRFCDVKKALGQNAGSTINFDKVSDIATQGGKLVETTTFSKTKFTLTQGTGVVTEYGNAISLTKKYKTLSELEAKNIVNKSLKVDAAKTIDESAALEFNKTLLRYVGLTTTSSALTVDGTATGTNTSALNKFHWKNVIDIMAERNIPTYDGQHYVCIASVRAIRGIYDDIESMAAYQKDVRLLPGEVGRYYDCRIVRATWGLGQTWRTARYSAVNADTGPLINGAWNTGLSDEAFFFGQETVMEIIALPEQVRAEENDLGREQVMGWYGIMAYKLIWGESGDAANAKIIKWDTKA